MSRNGPLALAFHALFLLFILAPLLVVIAVSFTSQGYMAMPSAGVSLRWWRAIGDNPRFLASFWYSVRLGVTSATLSALIAVPAALAIARRRFPGRDALAALLASPLMIPHVVLGVALCLICAVVGDLLYSARTLEVTRASTDASNLSAAIAQDVARNVELFDLSIQGVVDGLSDPAVAVLPRRLQQLVLFDRAATAPYLGAILVLDEHADLVMDSRRPDVARVNYLDRDYFQAQAARADLGLFISRPLISRTDGQPIIGLSRRISKPDGSFGGVVAGTLHLEYLHQLFSKMKLGPNGSITLFQTDGTLIMREPFDPTMIGRAVKPAELFEHLAKAPEGEYQAASAVDGVERLIRYRRIGALPLVQTVAVSIADIYADWWRRASVIVGVLALCCTIIVVLAQGLKRELRGRTLAEAALLLLAEEDGLTGIANRRHFDDVLRAEWLKAARTRKPLSLLMIDADHFKAYNDAFGHLKGDAALKQVAACLKRHISLPQHLAARYGGEEFAVILPETDAAGALATAEAIRCGVLDLSLPHPQSELHRLSISVGTATLVPEAVRECTDLVARADAALYASKAGGRNRSTGQCDLVHSAA